MLKRGLTVSARKSIIAEDLGYIYRDEMRYHEAAEMFQIAADKGASTCFIYAELAQAYGMIGESEKQQKYLELYKRETPLPLTRLPLRFRFGGRFWRILRWWPW